MDSLTRLAVTLLASAVIAGCATTAGDFCTTAKPLRPTAATIEAMSDDEVADMLAHNEYGARTCAWRP